MASRTEHKAAVKETPEIVNLTFKCRLCGEEKPFAEMIMIRNYYPNLAVCQVCFRAHNTNVQ